jgi:hypothetical protein
MIFPHGRRHRSGSIFGALILLAIGFLFLAGSMLPGWSIERIFARGWPLILIATGLATLVRHIVRAPFRGRLNLTGPLVMITTGILFALQTFLHIGFHRTWPILLIVIAISMVFKRVLMLPFLPFVRRRI